MIDQAEIDARVERGAKLFDELWPGWETRFEREPITGIIYTNECSRCIADIASGMPGQEGWDFVFKLLLERHYAASIIEHGLCTLGYEDYQDEKSLVAAWRALIESRRTLLTLPAPVSSPATPEYAIAK